MSVERKYERDVDLLLAEEFSVSPKFANWFLGKTSGFRNADARVLDVYVSRSDITGESDLVVVYQQSGNDERFALHIEDKIVAPLQADQERRYRLRGEAGIKRGEYARFEVVLCSPQNYMEVHPEVAAFDARVTYEEIATFLRSQEPDRTRSQYRAQFISTAAGRSVNTWKLDNDELTNRFWDAAYNIASREFVDLEMKPLKVTKGSTWINLRPRDMPTSPRRVYLFVKGDRGIMDLTFTACRAYLLQPQIKDLLDERMTVHQTGKSAAIRIVVAPFRVVEPDDDVLSRVRSAFSACVDLVRFYRGNREAIDLATERSILSE
jgi:hypothetical protein